MIKFLAIALLFLLHNLQSAAQNNISEEFVSPLNIPLFLSGNYGELRSGHFHAGIDIKTQGVKGKPVFASNKGYVSRIKIQSGGYGNALYITHPNGYTSVYGHLDRFVPEIQEYVESRQYEKKRFEIELFPGMDQFVVEQNEVIAYSGNSGRSGGPHLHFEIRNSNGQIPINGLRFNFPVADNIPPSFTNLIVYNLSEEEIVANSSDTKDIYQVSRKNDTLYIISDTINATGEFHALGTEVYDYLNGSPNQCGVYSMNFFLNEELLYGFTIDAISFANTRYINAHMDYALKEHEGKSVHRLHALPNNRLRIYNTSNGNGIFSINNDEVYSVRIEAFDVYGHKATLYAHIRKKSNSIKPDPAMNSERISWGGGGILQEGPFRVTIPPSALYNDIFIDLQHSKTGDLLSDTLIVHNSSEPLHKSMTLRVNLDSVSLPFRDKLVFARINEEKELESEDGECIDSKLITSTRNFGKYVIVPDTIKPAIIPINFSTVKKYSAGEGLKFKVVDDLSGINSYNAYIDDQWVLLKYDAKSDIMEYIIDSNRITSGSDHTFRIEIIDKKGNLAHLSRTFYY